MPSERSDPVYTTNILEAGKYYVIQATGVFSYWDGSTDGADAYYDYRDQGAEFRPLQIDDQSMYDIAKKNGDPVEYNPNHFYETSIVGAGKPLKFWILDPGPYSDNHGSLEVKVYQKTDGQSAPPENHQPTVSLNYLPEYPTDMDRITLKANAQDPDGDQLMYSWFILGNEIVNETGTELYNQLDPGDYEYTVNVSDGKGGIAEDTVRFTVIKKTPSPPCDRLLLDLEEGQNSVVIAKVVDDCEHNPLSL